MNIRGIIAGASNVRGGQNPPYTADGFKAAFPQFFGEDGPLVPEPVLQMYLDFAHACVIHARYGAAWQVCMGWFVAHFLTLYLQSAAGGPEGASAQEVMAAGATRGLVASKSVGGASIGFDNSTALQDLNGWAAWKLTIYGVQFATLSKTFTMGGMYIP